MTADLPFLPLTELARRLAAGDVTAIKIVEACLANIEAQDAKLHAFVEVYRDDAIRLAVASDLERQAGFARGPLHGLPFAIKDLFHVQGRQTTSGSKSCLGRMADETALCVQRLLAAGMIPLGKTHMVEFAYGTWGTNQPMGAPWNPWDPAVHRVAGGSSSGSAVAVAAGMAPVALGTDTGGSVRIPAALCGLAGLKPTYGSIPLDGVVPLSATLDSIGPIARTVDDAAWLVDAMAGRPVAAIAPVPSIEGVRIAALTREQFPDFIEPDVVAGFERAIAELESLGARVEPTRFPFDFAALGTKNGRLIGIEGYAVQRAFIDDAQAEIDPGVRARMLIGKSATAADYLEALAEREATMRAFAAWMHEQEALLTPMLPITAKPVQGVDETSYPLATWSRAVNYVGACAMSIPAGLSKSGLPIGVQLIGAAGRDDTIVRIGRAFQSITDWHRRRPPAATR